MQEAAQQGCTVLAIGGMPDHVHVLVKLSSITSLAALVKQMKCVSSAMLNDKRDSETIRFAWQAGYSCFSVSRPHVWIVKRYILRQKQHHARGLIWAQWEETGEGALPEKAS